MQHPLDDPLLPLAKAATQLKRALGVSVHVSTLHRWREVGTGGRRLQCKRLGGRWYTSLGMLQAFFADGGASPGPPVTGGRRAVSAQQRLADEFGA